MFLVNLIKIYASGHGTFPSALDRIEPYTRSQDGSHAGDDWRLTGIENTVL